MKRNIETSAGLRCLPGLCVWCDRDYWATRRLFWLTVVS